MNTSHSNVDSQIRGQKVQSLPGQFGGILSQWMNKWARDIIQGWSAA